MQLLSSVSKALTLLDAFTAEKPQLTLSELARRAGAHKSSAFRLLSTLEAHGFVEKSPAGRGYRLGWKPLELAGRLLGRYELRELAAPFMEELAKKSGEIVHLSILDGSQIVYLDKRGRSQPLTVSTTIGGRSPAHASAMGKVLLAGLPAAELQRVLGGQAPGALHACHHHGSTPAGPRAASHPPPGIRAGQRGGLPRHPLRGRAPAGPGGSGAGGDQRHRPHPAGRRPPAGGNQQMGHGHRRADLREAPRGRNLIYWK